MKISGAEIFRLSLKLKNPYTIAYHSFDRAEHLFLRIDAGGYSGWGCMAPDPFVTGEDLNEIYPEVSNSLPELLKKTDPFRRAKLLEHIKKEYPLYPGVWAAVDMALWDILGKKAGLPVWKIIGGYRSSIETSVTISICNVSETLERASEFAARGFRILKIKGGNNPAEDAERLIKVSEKFKDRFRLRFDANQGYSRDQAMDFLDAVKDIPLELFEQPTGKSDGESLGHISSNSSIPVMADESLLSLLDAFKLARKGLVDMLNIKIMKIGGITEAIQVDSVARSARIKVMVGCMDESALGISAGLHFALSRKNILYADLDGHLDLVEDPAADCVRLEKGRLYPSIDPGLGWTGF